MDLDVQLPLDIIHSVVRSTITSLQQTTKSVAAEVKAGNNRHSESVVDQDKEISELERRLKNLDNECEQFGVENGKYKAEVQDKERNPCKKYLEVSNAKLMADNNYAKDLRRSKRRNMAANAVRSLLDYLGVKVFVDTDKAEESTYFIYFNGIHPDCGNRSFSLSFSELGGPNGKFHVEKAVPSFREFKHLSKEANSSQNLPFLIARTRQYWIRDQS